MNQLDSSAINPFANFIAAKGKDVRGSSKYQKNGNQQLVNPGAYVVPKLLEFGFQKIESNDFKAVPLTNSNKVSLKNKYGMNENYNNISGNNGANSKISGKNTKIWR